MSKEKLAAALTVHGPSRMTARGRRQIATWLRRQAAFLLEHHDKLTSGRYTARYLYR